MKDRVRNAQALSVRICKIEKEDPERAK